MADIHATAVVDPSAKLGTGVEIGPFCVIGPDVELGEGTKVHSHAAIGGSTTLGAECEVFPFASIGQRPQDVKYRGEPSTLTIGPKTTIREYVTINPGTGLFQFVGAVSATGGTALAALAVRGAVDTDSDGVAACDSAVDRRNYFSEGDQSLSADSDRV